MRREGERGELYLVSHKAPFFSGLPENECLVWLSGWATEAKG